MNIQDIKKRKSVRTFSEQPIPKEILDALQKLIDTSDNPFHVPIQLKILDAKKHNLKSPVIVGSDIYVAGKYQKSEQAEIAFGYELERFILFATSFGLGTVWLAATIDRKAFEKAISLKSDEVMPAVTPLGYPSHKPSIRESLMRKGMKSDERLPFDAIFFKENFQNPLKKEDAGILQTPLEMVRIAPSATNKQPWRIVASDTGVHFYEKKTKGYAKESLGDIQKVDLGIAMCHFEIAAKEIGLSGKFVQANPMLPAADDTDYLATYEWER